MKRHSTDLVSLTFGVIFAGIAAWWLIGRYLLDLRLDVPNLGLIIAAALVLLGLLGVVGSLRREAKPDTDNGFTAAPVSPPAPTTAYNADTTVADPYPADTYRPGETDAVPASGTDPTTDPYRAARPDPAADTTMDTASRQYPPPESYSAPEWFTAPEAPTKPAGSRADEDAVESVDRADRLDAAEDEPAERDADPTDDNADRVDTVAEEDRADTVAEQDPADTVAQRDAADTIAEHDPADTIAGQDRADTVAEHAADSARDERRP